MSFKDLREFIAKLEEEGELQRIKVEVDWDVELSAIMRRVFELNGPACLFEKVKDTDYRVFSGGLFGHKKYSLAIGSPPDLKVIYERMMHALENPTPPVMVDSGPCKDNIETGDKINLVKFPVPKWHHLDGGRYIGTLGVSVTKDPETGIRNLAVYRQQMLGKSKTGFNTEQQGGIHLQKYRAQGRPMPVATCIGVPPSVLCGALTHAPYGYDELNIAGTIAGGPIPLVKCETVDLEVPAYSEIVLEGVVPPDTSLWELEGPFGEFTGHFSTLEKTKKPIINLTAVTYRNDPIYQGCSPGVPPTEDNTLREIGHTIGAWYKIMKSGIPGIKDVYVTEMGCGGFTLVVSMEDQFYLGHVRDVIYAAFQAEWMTKWVIVVDADIDIHDMGQVEWALATRVQPHRDIIITDDRCRGVVLDPSINPTARKIPIVQASKVGIDATIKFKGHEFAPVVRDTEEQRRLIEKRWKEYGFKI